MSLRQYRLADLTVLTLLAFLASLVSEAAFRSIANSLVYFNFGLLIGAIAMVRWNAFGALAYVAAGIPLMWFRNVEGDLFFQLSFYVLSNGVIALASLLFPVLGKERIGKSFRASAGYLLAVFGLVWVTKATLLVIVGEALVDAFLIVVSSKLLTFLLTALAFGFLSQFGKGLITDMKHYIIQTQEEEAKTID